MNIMIIVQGPLILYGGSRLVGLLETYIPGIPGGHQIDPLSKLASSHHKTASFCDHVFRDDKMNL